MTMHPSVPAGGYKDLVLFLATAGIIAPLFKRLKVSPVLGFLGAGVVLGPFGLGSLAGNASWLSVITVTKPDEIAQLAEFGVVFLLFMIGLELSWERLRLMRRMVFGLGLLQVVVCAGAIAAAALLVGLPLAAAIVAGAALTLSSTAIILPVLSETRRLHAEAGRASFAVLLFQDLAVAPIMITLSVIAAGGGFTPARLLSFAPAAAGLASLVVIGRLLLRPMLRSVARARSEEMFMAASLLVVIGAGLVAEAAGLSMALGAFIAGLLLAETEYRHEVEVTIEPFKGLLLGLFFVSVGIRLDLARLIAHPFLILGLTAGLIAIKAVISALCARLMGLRWVAAAETALALAPGGEFAFVIIGAAMAAGLIGRAPGESLLVATTLGMFAIPMLVGVGARIGRGAAAPRPEEATPPDLPEAERVLVVGYGRVGRLVGDMLGRHQIDWVAVDRDPREAEAGRRAGQQVFFGDAARGEFLRRLGLGGARALVVTMDAPEAVEAVVIAARQLRPDLTIVARARDTRHAQRLYEFGATDVVPETVEASLQLSEAVLVDIGVPMGLVIASIHQRRDEYRKLLNRPEALGARGRRARDALKR
jgi:CPA2 family monovalent cation:H+ antiporter-2